MTHGRLGPTPTHYAEGPVTDVSSSQEGGSKSPPQPKQRFADPHLVTYGDIRQIAEAVGMVGATDTGGMSSMVKTR
jgi:hypothetical protein